MAAALFAGMIAQADAGGTGKLDPFHSVIITSEIEAELILSDSAAIETRFENGNEEDLIAEVVDSVLKIRMKTGSYKDARLKVIIHYNRDLKMVQASARAKIQSWEALHFGGNLSVKLNNGGEMRLKIFCDSLHADLSQGSVFHVTGKARALGLTVSSGATYSGYEFETKNAYVSASSLGKAKVSVSEFLDARATTSGFIGYVGDPETVKKKVSLKGEVVKTFLE